VPASQEFLVATAHELRLPLSHIQGFVTSLRRTDVKGDDDTWKEFIAEIDLATDRMAEPVDSLLPPSPTDSSRPGTVLAFSQPISVVLGALHGIRDLLEGRLL
jgi:signal transduction histidine kinase